jgi:DNA-binding response OmpR family regulator
MGDRTGRILVVDGDRRVRRALRALAGAVGHDVIVEAADVAEARRAVVDDAPVVAVVEPMLPTLTEGCALVRDLAASGIAVLALSVRPAARPGTCAAGATAFLTKNCTPEQLLDGIDRLLGNGATRIGAPGA